MGATDEHAGDGGPVHDPHGNGGRSSVSSRRRTAAVLLLLAVTAAGVAVTTVAAGQTNARIANVTVTPSEPAPGETVTFDVTITNLESSSDTVDVTDLFIRSDGSTNTHSRLENVGSIAPGSDITVRMTGTFGTPGSKRLTVFAVTRNETGAYTRYEYPVYVDVVEPSVRAGLSTSPAGNGSDGTTVEVTNYGNVDLTDVELVASAEGEVVRRYYTLDVAPGQSRAVTFDEWNAVDGPVTFTATYDAAGESHETSITEAGTEQVLGEIRLTAVEATRTGSGVTIQGEAANVGSTDTESVLVSVGDAAGVSPTAPNGEYFVGAVDASEFATFELTAQADADVSEIPVEISYIVDGERVTRTQQVDVGTRNVSDRGGAPSPDGGSPDGSGGPALSPVVLVLALLLVVVGVVGLYRWRSR